MTVRKAGDFFHRVSIERRSAGADDGYGNQAQSWSVISGYDRVSAKVEMIASKRALSEQLAAGRLQSTSTALVTLLYKSSRSKTAIIASDRIVIHSSPYSNAVANIRQINLTPDNWHLVLTVEFNAPT